MSMLLGLVLCFSLSTKDISTSLHGMRRQIYRAIGSCANNALGLEWLKHFDRHTKVGEYKLLVLDGHKSYVNQGFKDYCLEHKILNFCMPLHSLYVLQSLDVVCSSLSLLYGNTITL
jgi:hypothetical protein